MSSKGKEEGKLLRVKKRRLSIIGLQHLALLETQSEFALEGNLNFFINL